MTNITRSELRRRFAEEFATPDSFTRKDFLDFAESIGARRGTATGILKSLDKVRHGVYTMSLSSNAPTSTQPKEAENVVSMPVSKKSKVESITSGEDEVYIPKKVSEYVKWGYFKDVKKIIESKMFFPIFISGLSGNGKTMMVEQACATTKREFVRVQITPETDEDDLIGGFRLVNGETVFSKGPVIKAMEAGAVLLIDEIDRGSNKLMALQGVLEGKPVLIKKTGEIIEPAPGFNVIATANTKGQGDDAGRFIAATIIDEAFLERFTITMEQPYASSAVEKKIIINHMKKFGEVDENFAERLVQWGQAIRKTFEDGGVDDMISTRRLCHIVQTYSIFNDRKRSVELCVNRFDSDTKTAFIDLYEKIDSEVGEGADSNTSTDGVYTYDDQNPF